MATSAIKKRTRLSDRICFRVNPRYCEVTFEGVRQPVGRWNYWVMYMTGPVLTHEEASVWLKIIGWIGGIFFSFVAGVVSATWVVANRVRDIEGKVELMNEGHKTRDAVCATYREGMKGTISKSVKEGMDGLRSTLGEEIILARDQRTTQAVQLEQLQAAVIAGNSNIVRLHERIDEVLLNDRH